MSENKSPLKAVGERIKAGLGKINSDAKAKAEGKNTPPQHDDLNIQEELDTPQPKGGDDRLSAHKSDDEDIEEGFIIDNEAEPAKPKGKGLGTKQKVLVVAACVVAALWFTKQQSATPPPAGVASNEQHLDGFKQQDSAPSGEVEGPAFDLNASNAHSDEPIAVAPAGNDADALGFGGAGAKDAANDPIGSDVLTADLNEQFSTPPEENNEVLDPFTGKVKNVPTHPSDLPVPEKPHAQPVAMLPAAESSQHGSATDLAMIGAPGDSPFNVGGSNSTELSGTKTQNPDSKAGVLQDQSANADVTGLKAKLAEKDNRIGSLETEVSKLKKDLATAKLEPAKAKPGPTKAAPSKATQHKPVQAVHSTQRSTPSQRVASAPKALPRPQICVTAVAQAARNCTTCVPHAFITHRGVETMVGQGDFLDGLRVKIEGDRLDLQNAQGDVVHKFWSSPNGCAAS